ncbi:hypothetical protein BDZ45DRAFT_672297 [Acephala macrosclerotiorum]|nr:hypothetical protein BDZ45DRAFT_672297 [Acephala macrosclerotiorum]
MWSGVCFRQNQRDESTCRVARGVVHADVGGVQNTLNLDSLSLGTNHPNQRRNIIASTPLTLSILEAAVSTFGNALAEATTKIKMPTLNEAMPGDLRRIMTSEIFILIPSNSNAAFKIPKALLSSISKPFGASAEGGWIETGNGSHKFLVQDESGSEADVTENVLICFIKWAFTGQYSTEDVGISSHVEQQIPQTEEPDFWGISKKGKKNRKFGRTEPSFVEETPPPSDWPEPESEPPADEFPVETEAPPAEEASLAEPPAETEAPPAEEASPTEPQEEIVESISGSNASSVSKEASAESREKTDPLFLHIQVYVFAIIYQINELQNVSRRKLKAYLQDIERSTDNYTSKMFDMLDYAFLHLSDEDKLLQWLAKYSAWKLGTLREDFTRLDVLLRATDGKFSSMLVRCVAPSQVNPFAGQGFM